MSSVLCGGKNPSSFACEAVAHMMGQANVPECAVGFLFLSFSLFTVVVFLALALTIAYPQTPSYTLQN